MVGFNEDTKRDRSRVYIYDNTTTMLNLGTTGWTMIRQQKCYNKMIRQWGVKMIWSRETTINNYSGIQGTYIIYDNNNDTTTTYNKDTTGGRLMILQWWYNNYEDKTIGKQGWEVRFSLSFDQSWIIYYNIIGQRMRINQQSISVGERRGGWWYQQMMTDNNVRL